MSFVWAHYPEQVLLATLLPLQLSALAMMTEVAADSPMTNLTSFIADLLSSGAPIIRYEDVQRTRDLATGNTFTVCSGLYRDKVIAIKYFNFTAPQDMFSVVSMEVAGEILRENLANASHEIRIMTNNILRRCPNIATLEGVFFETEDPAWIRPALVMELAYDAAPTLTDLLRMPQTPLVKRSLVNNIFDGLYALHSVKICHSDVKPDNVLIFSLSDDPRVPYQARVSDFGFAFVNGQTPRGSGTEGWCAPECHFESSEPLWREKAYGRDVFSAALVMRTVFDAPSTARPSIDEEQNTFDRNLSVNERMQHELEPQMLCDRPENRPWIEDLRKELRKLCKEEGVEPLQWSWIAKDASMTKREIEPVRESAQLKGKISSWLINHREVENLSVPVQNTLFQELKAGAADPTDPARADHLNALFVCYHQGKLIDKDSRKAWDILWEAARAGSQFAQGQVMFYIMETKDFSCSTAEERRDWSVICLMSTNHLGHKLLKKMDVAICEKGLRTAVYDHGTALERRKARRDSILPLAKLIQDRLEPQHWSSVLPLIPNLTLAVSGADFESLQKLLNTTIGHNEIREVLLQALLEYAVLSRQKQLMYFLFSRYSVDALAEDPGTHHNALTRAIFEDRNDAVTWLLDLGVDRKLFASQLIFARVVCNSTWTMTTTYIQTCWTYYRDFGLKKLLNESAPPVQGKNIPPPLILSILARNGDPFAALLRYNANVNQRWGIWTPLLLTVAHGLPHFTAQLIEKGANITDCTTDDAAMTIAHVLADAEASGATNEDRFLWDMFDRAPEDRSGSPLTPSQARRYTDCLLYAMLRDIGVPFDVRDGAGRLPLEVAISSGKLWIADVIEIISESDNSLMSKRFQVLQDVDGRSLLSYAVEDGDHSLAKELLGQGYNIDASNIMGKTTLHEAAEHCKLENVLFCLHHGANGQQKDLLGRTALTWAIANGDIATCKVIISHAGSEIFLERTAAQETFLHCALKANQCETLLALLDLYLELRDAGGLPKLSEVLGYVDVSGRTCLHDVCISRTWRPNASMNSALNRLVSLSQNVSPVDCVGDTPLHDAANNSNSQESCLRCSRVLIAAGAKVNAQNELGNSPLHYAYQRQGEKQQLIDLLLESGADASLKNHLGLTANEWRSAVLTGIYAAKKADQDYKKLYDQRSGWRAIQEKLQRAKSENEARCVQGRLAFLGSYNQSGNAVPEPRTNLALRLRVEGLP